MSCAGGSVKEKAPEDAEEANKQYQTITFVATTKQNLGQTRSVSAGYGPSGHNGYLRSARMTGQMSWTWSTWRLTVVTVLVGGFWPTSVRVVRDSLGAAARGQVGDQAEADGKARWV